MSQWRATQVYYASVLAASTVVFAALAAAVLFLARVDELDVRFVRWVHRSAPQWLVETMEVVTYAGSSAFLAPLTLVAAALLVRSRRPAAAAFVVAALVGARVLDEGLKAAFRRARPELEDPFVQLTTYAFPSGHAFSATAVYGALALVLASTPGGRRRRGALVAAALTLVVLVAASRVVLGVHYLLDVLAGVAGGVALLATLLLAFERAGRPVLSTVVVWGHEQDERARVHPELER